MLKFRILALIALGLVAQSLSSWSAARADEMNFRVVGLDSGGCGANCPKVIAAEGEIGEATPDAFKQKRELKRYVQNETIRDTELKVKKIIKK
jgi:hypothetical protein